ncbi:hypothetical protein [Actinomadura sp. 7K534]|uniref:hypothetical protein n=1 Tax=Actinomadura sp. 7K534 TaxID=2530366 RepID=UPI001053CCCE|nr:hypothetical protein [Actinomadura sp. 7K534]TDB96410.1 hypothetical protein E1266_09915 [Actinomadura sp. 7K534]
MRDGNGASILRHPQVHDARGCAPPRTRPFEIPAGRMTTYPGAVCLLTEPGRPPAEVIFNFSHVSGQSQYIMEVPLSP